MTPRANVRAADGKRTLAAFPVGLLAMIADQSDRFLVLSSPDEADKWEPISGAMEHGETPSDGILREISEEAGPDLRVRPYGAIHAGTYPYDDAIPDILGIAFAFRAENDVVTPGDDMEGQQVRWVSVGEIEAGEIDLSVPAEGAWLFRRALEALETRQPISSA